MQIGFALVVAVLLFVGVVAYRSVIALTDSSLWVQHTNEVLGQLTGLRLAMEEVESGYRDYALSGNAAFLQVSRARNTQVERELSVLGAATADNARQQARLRSIAEMTRKIIHRGDSLGDSLGVSRGVPTGSDDPLMEEFRAATRDMEDEERRLLHDRGARSALRYRQSKLALILGSVLAILIAAFAGWMVPRDHSERRVAGEKLRRLNRLYAMVSGINALGIRVRDRDDLFRNSCRIAVEHGEFEMAWIGIVEGIEPKIVPMAWAGADEKTMTAIQALFAGSEGSIGGPTLAARAIREKTAVVSNNVPRDESLLFGKMHTDSGVRSIATLPLIVADQAIGVFVLYTSKREFFDAAGMDLLTELAGNVAFAIDHIQKQERLDHFAYYDGLTGLANRSLFLDRVTQHMHGAAEGGHKMALILIDLERFRKINDTLGRPAGDELLNQVAAWLARNVGNVNLLARVGEDHFGVVLPEVAYESDVVRLIEKASAAFQNHPFILHDAEYRIAARAGVALYPDDGADADTLFKNAEAALKKAKVGRDRFLFYAQKMTDTFAGSLGIENRLRLALAREEFVLHYQPKINLSNGQLTGAEALIRWNDRKTGLVPPARFISILEETGLIHEVGQWALRKAIDEHLRWRNAGLHAVRIAVNVSPLQLRSKRFVAEIEEVVNRAAGAAEGLELEITETLIMEDVNHSIVSLLAIRALGVTVAIDDFGTGFSSLSYLSKLPVDTLKIDRSFIVDMVTGAGGFTLVSVIVNLAHALRLKVVAEGVETDEQLRQLRLLRCDEMQGYLFGKPVPGEIFEKKYLQPAAVLHQ